MATGRTTKNPCSKCNKGGATFTCDGCHQSFCLKHTADHRQELAQQMDDIGQQHDVLKRDVAELSVEKTLVARIDRWEEESIQKIRSTAEKVRADLRQLTEESKIRLSTLMKQLSNELRSNQESDEYTEEDLDRWVSQLKELRKDLEKPSGIEISQNDASSIRFIMIQAHDKKKEDDTHSTSQTTYSVNRKSFKPDENDRLLQDGRDTPKKSELLIDLNPTLSQTPYLSLPFGLTQSNDRELRDLFKHLMMLAPMDKNGPMNGKCSFETDQMEWFLTETFGFENIRGQSIVQGVKSFRLKIYPNTMDPNKTIHFPKASANAFMMTVKEIIQWQRSYKVYADKSIRGMTKEYLNRALQGQSGDGEEAFHMKFVVRISACPILMEFDAKLISRKLTEEWPNRIKLVSVTGIDFAGRKHDVEDIFFYLSNWKDVYEIDRTRDIPALVNERDFRRRRSGPKGELYQDRLLTSLIDMARFRLRACDVEGVEIVVETGIGLGVFAGEDIGIAEEVQFTSALAIRTVLDQDGPNYKSIRAIVFALPIIEKEHNRRSNNPFTVFAEQFHNPQYNGRIPVLIADQDMHRLTVAIARQGFIVSEVNPADSHGIFGGYWQNRGPAVEEKLALTTLGLLVQHHLINPHVLDTKNYHIL